MSWSITVTDRTLTATWDGEGFTLPPISKMKCREWALTAGEQLVLEIQRPRHRKNHQRFMARVREIHATLPERLATAPFAQSADHLRYHALIVAGVSDTTTHVAKSMAEAERVAETFHRFPGYSVVQIVGTTVMRHTALSQAFAAMNGEDFRKSAKLAEEWMQGLLEENAA